MSSIRPYQQEAVDAVSRAIWEGERRFLYTCATGTGKTNIMAWVVRELTEIKAQGLGGMSPHPILIIAHTEEIINQIRERIVGVLGLDRARVQIERGADSVPMEQFGGVDVIVSSIQTLLNPARLKDLQPFAVIVDECHHYAQNEWRKALERFWRRNQNTILIGCTATAKRTDRIALCAYDVDGNPNLADHSKLQDCIFQRHVYDYGILDAMRGGYLCEVVGRRVRTEVDLTGISTRAGDFAKDELSKAVNVEDRTRAAISAWKEYASDRPTIVFCASVDHAHDAAEMWKQSGVAAEACDGTTLRYVRHNALERFRSGATRVLCNYNLWIEGFDAPHCACIVMLRPTKSWPIYVQMAGRGLRPLPGIIDGLDDAAARIAAIRGSLKPNALILDVVDIHKGKSLCTAPSLLDLPPMLDLSGHGILETLDLMNEYEQSRVRLLLKEPKSYEELRMTVEQMNPLENSPELKQWKESRRRADIWERTDLPPGRKATLHRGEDGHWNITAYEHGEAVYSNHAHARTELINLFAGAEKALTRAYPTPKPKPRNNWSDAQRYWLRKAGFTEDGIAALSRQQGSAVISKMKGERDAHKMGATNDTGVEPERHGGERAVLQGESECADAAEGKDRPVYPVGQEGLPINF